VYVTPKSPKGWHKPEFAVFASKIQLLSKKVCCKVSLCENFQRQSCSYIIPLLIGQNEMKSNQKQIYIAPYVASESEAHGGDD